MNTDSLGYTPSIFDLSKLRDRHHVRKLFDERKISNVVDDYAEEERELFQVQNPTLVYSPDFESKFSVHLKGLEARMPSWQRGQWVYFPWLSAVSHILPDREFQLVRTARNKNLITAAEQEKFYNATIGIAGLSVGNSVALTIALQGGGRHMRLADFDNLSLSNTNRVRAGVQNLGVSKVGVTARQIYEINPYAQVEMMTDGVTPANIKQFFSGLDIVIDEIDNLAVKVLLREHARKNRIAVVMAADNGDNGVVDIERYDLNKNLPPFHGRMGKVSYKQLVTLDKFGIGKLITKHIGAENVTQRMKDSLLQMGKTIVSWPQLGNAALLNGAAVSYCVRRIVNQQPLEQNRALVSLDEKLLPGFDSPRSRRHRAKSATAFKKIFGL